MTVAHVLLERLHPKRPGRPKKKLRISADKALRDLSAHLHWLMGRHATKSYTDSYLIGQCYGKSKTITKDTELRNYCRVNLILATKCFDDLIAGLSSKTGKVSHADAMALEEVISDYIFDLLPFVEYLERQRDPNYVFLRGRKSGHVHTWEVFRVSRQMAVQSALRREKLHIDHKTAQIVSVFTLRQALEAKFERLTGVHFYDKIGGTPKLKHGFQYDFILSHLNYFNFKAVTFSDLKKIYEWASEVVHRVYQPFAWQLAFAHKFCGGLFYSINTPPNQAWSINNAVEINHWDDMQAAYIKHFNTTITTEFGRRKSGSRKQTSFNPLSSCQYASI